MRAGDHVDIEEWQMERAASKTGCCDCMSNLLLEDLKTFGHTKVRSGLARHG
jgi:hypothetical protein